jgi:hypothetical protein
MARACKDVCGLAPSSSHLLTLRLVGTPSPRQNPHRFPHSCAPSSESVGQENPSGQEREDRPPMSVANGDRFFSRPVSIFLQVTASIIGRDSELAVDSGVTL